MNVCIIIKQEGSVMKCVSRAFPNAKQISKKLSVQMDLCMWIQHKKRIAP